MKDTLKTILIGLIALTIIYIIPYLIYFQNEGFLMGISKITMLLIMGMLLLTMGVLIIYLCYILGDIIMEVVKGLKKKMNKSTKKGMLHD